MPKVHGTRKEKALELQRRLQDGPSFSGSRFMDEPFTPEMAKAQYKLWSSTLILGDLSELVPELKRKKSE